MNDFKSLYEGYKDKVYFFTRKIVKNNDDTEDIVQDIFVHLWKHRKKLTETENIESIIFKTAKQEIANYYRRNKIAYTDIEILPYSDDELVYEESVNSDAVKKVYLFLEQVPEKSKIFFLKNNFENKTYSEIAKEYNISKQAVEQHVNKVKRFLKAKLSTLQY